MLNAVSVCILIAGFGALFADFIFTATKDNKRHELQSSAQADYRNGFTYSCIIAWIPPMLINFMYAANYRESASPKHII